MRLTLTPFSLTRLHMLFQSYGSTTAASLLGVSTMTIVQLGQHSISHGSTPLLTVHPVVRPGKKGIDLHRCSPQPR